MEFQCCYEYELRFGSCFFFVDFFFFGGGGSFKRIVAVTNRFSDGQVRLWEDGFKERYYESKFAVAPTDEAFRHKVACEYVRGLCWVLQYYYQGCASWKWFFPYHYAPFASDFQDVSGVSTVFEKNTKPVRALLSCPAPTSSTYAIDDGIRTFFLGVFFFK